MASLKKTNVFRRKLMKALTKSLGDVSESAQVFLDKDAIKRVLVCRPNHRLGNQLLLSPLLQEVSELFPNCKIDLFVKGNLSPILFKNYGNIDKIIRLPKKHFKQLPLYLLAWAKIKNRKYDLVINVDERSSSGRISTKLARGTFKIFEGNGSSSELDDHQHLAKRPIYNLRNLFPETTAGALKKIPNLDLKLNVSEIQAGKKIIEDLVNNKKESIAIFTYATGNKCYSKTWWSEFYEKLQYEFKEFNIIEILPVENVSQIDFKAPSFYSKNIREITSVIANTAVFIGADSGMMHLASASRTPVIGLFCVTDMEKYKPYGQKSIGVNTNERSMDEIIEIAKKALP